MSDPGQPPDRYNGIVMVVHSWGGGTERHVRELADRLDRQGVDVLMLRIGREPKTIVKLSRLHQDTEMQLGAFSVPDELLSLSEKLAACQVTHMHIHHLVGAGHAASDMMRAIASAAEITYDVTVHDYYLICPRINLIDESGFYCGEPAVSACDSCVVANGSWLGRFPVGPWREQSARLLHGARKVFAPSKDVAARVTRYFPGVTTSVVSHPDDARSILVRGVSGWIAPMVPRRVAVIGTIGPHKGAAVLHRTAEYARRCALPINFVVIGQTDRDSEFLDLGNVVVTGPYEEADVQQLLRSHDCDFAWFPAVWPETYSFTLSTANAAGLYPVAFNLGAIAERILGSGLGRSAAHAYSDPAGQNCPDALQLGDPQNPGRPI